MQRALKVQRSTRLMLVLTMLAAAFMAVFVKATPARAAGSYDNATIASKGLAYVGQYYGQCWTFARDMIYSASGGTQDISAAAGGGDYFAHLQNAGGTEITSASNLSKGDVVQIGQYDSDPSLHTFIIVAYVSGSTFDIVDANHNSDGVVHEYNRTVTLGSNQRAYRFGTVNGGSSAPSHFKSVAADFNGDGKADIGLMDMNNGVWYFQYGPSFGAATQTQYAWGTSGVDHYQTFAADFNGDGKADIGVMDNNTGIWYIKHGPGFSDQITFAWGTSGVTHYQTFAADFNGDGKADIGVMDINSGTWYIRYGPDFSSQTVYAWGTSGLNHYQSVAADFNGDGKADIGVMDNNTGIWYFQYGPSFGGATQTVYPWGTSGVNHYQTFAADFNGDGKADIGVRDRNNGIWYFQYGPSFGGATQTQYQWAAD